MTVTLSPPVTMTVFSTVTLTVSHPQPVAMFPLMVSHMSYSARALAVHCGSYPLHLPLYSGAGINLIRDTDATLVGATISKASQNAFQADGRSKLTVLGETTLSLRRGSLDLTPQALVVWDLDVDVFAGTPFMPLNQTWVRLSFFIFNSVSESFESGSTHDSQWLSRIDSNGFPGFLFKSTQDSKSCPDF